MSGVLRAWLAQGGALRWLTFDDYARRLFGGSGADWYREPMRQVAGLCDANRVLGSQILEFDLGALWIARADAAAGAMQRLAGVLASVELRHFCDQVVAALIDRQAGRADILLALPSPPAILQALGAGSDLDFDQLDDAAARMLDFLRPLAGSGVAGLVMSPPPPGTGAADAVEAQAPLQSAAAHYGWVFAQRIADSGLGRDWSGPAPDLWLPETAEVRCPETAPACTALPAGFWRAGLPAPAAAGVYGRVPADLDPALIAQRAAALP